MVKLKVEDMHCEKCVERISNVLEKADIKFNVSLKEKEVYVEEDKVSKAIEELDDIGFEAKKC